MEAVKKAVAAGKHVYCEKPTAMNVEEALELYRICENAGLKHGGGAGTNSFFLAWSNYAA